MHNFGILSEILSIAVALRSPDRLLATFGFFTRIFTKYGRDERLLKSCSPTTRGCFPDLETALVFARFSVAM